MATHFERLQAAIVKSVFFHKTFCRDAERIANLWMAEWDCFHSFRLSATNPRPSETQLTKGYIHWFFLHAYRDDISASSNLDRLSINIDMLETLPEEVQQEIIKHVHIPSRILSNDTGTCEVPEESQLQQQTESSYVPPVLPT